MPASLLTTKLFIPALRPETVTRKRLWERLDKAASSGVRFTLVSAPAGYGKTTLIAKWLSDSENCFSWFSVDDNDNDFVRFFSYFTAACKKIDTKVGDEALNLLSSSGEAAVETFVTLLINELVQIENHFYIVIDDYHLIKSPVIHQTVQLILDRMPDTMHLVLITREDPPFNLPRMRVRGYLCEIRVDDLRFDYGETSRFFLNTMDMEIRPEALKSISDRTEGWIAGIQLAALSIKGFDSSQVDEFLHDFSGKHYYIIDYLVEEVLKRQPLEIQDFLHKTAFLDRMNASLCDDVTGRSDSKIILQELQQENLFLIPLDRTRDWYRYHHLFADSLKYNVPDGEARIIYEKTYKWFEDNNQLQEAVNYAFKAENLPEAVRIMEQAQAELIAGAQLSTLLGWLDALPENMIRQSEVLTVRKGWALLITGKAREAVSYVSTIDEAAEAKFSPFNQGILKGLKASLAAYRGGDEAETLAREALALMGYEDPVARVSTLNTLTRELMRLNKMEESGKIVKEAFELGNKLGFTLVSIMAAGNMGHILILTGKRRESVTILHTYLDKMIEKHGKPLAASGFIFANLAQAYYEANELEKAYEFALKTLDYSSRSSLAWSLNALNLMAVVQYAMGNFEDALNTLSEAKKVNDPVNLALNAFKDEWLEAEFALRRGDKDAVRKWIERNSISVSDRPNHFQDQGYFTFARFLLLEERYQEAQLLLDNLRKLMEDSGRINRLISVLILQAVYFRIVSNVKRAQQALEQALTLAAEEGYSRPFLDEGRIMADMLSRIKHKAPDYIEKLLSLLNNPILQDEYTREICRKMKSSKKDIDLSSGLLEPLSARELELLKLIDTGLSNGEISEKLFISLHTTQWHISNLYSKLGVKSRIQALRKGKELGII